MTLSANLVVAFEQLAEDTYAIEQDAAALLAKLGDVTTLQTPEKESAVKAINSLHVRLGNLEVDPVTLETVNSLIATAKDQILGGAAEAYNTLKKVGDEIGLLKARVQANENAIAGLQGDVSGLNASVTALTANKADKTALQLTNDTLTNVSTKLNGLIDDGLLAGAENTYSINKIREVVDAMGATVKQDLLGGAGAAFDTLNKLKGFIDENGDFIETLNGVVANCVSFVDVQAITDPQAAIARANIKAAAKAEFDNLVAMLGDLTTDFKQAYLMKKASLVAAANA